MMLPRACVQCRGLVDDGACDGLRPCARCSASQIECSYDKGERTGASVGSGSGSVTAPRPGAARRPDRPVSELGQPEQVYPFPSHVSSHSPASSAASGQASNPPQGDASVSSSKPRVMLLRLPEKNNLNPCLSCKKHKKRCDGVRPACGYCTRRRNPEPCIYPPPTRRPWSPTSSKTKKHPTASTILMPAEQSPGIRSPSSQLSMQQTGIRPFSYHHPQQTQPRLRPASPMPQTDHLQQQALPPHHPHALSRPRLQPPPLEKRIQPIQQQLPSLKQLQQYSLLQGRNQPSFVPSSAASTTLPPIFPIAPSGNTATYPSIRPPLAPIIHPLQPTLTSLQLQSTQTYVKSESPATPLPRPWLSNILLDTSSLLARAADPDPPRRNDPPWHELRRVQAALVHAMAPAPTDARTKELLARVEQMMDAPLVEDAPERDIVRRQLNAVILELIDEG
ncbi:hypothetical protein BC830DRAFT_864760 [Chytriomyces sp. MP71]|nr:hypothetical protein BC830DRAFT_864760 [Chytriomyces sp. MP71]